MLARLCFFLYIGGKYNLLKALLPMVPPHQIYVEVFGGTANLLFNKAPSPVEIYYTQSVGIKYNTHLYVKDATIKQNEDCRRYD